MVTELLFFCFLAFVLGNVQQVHIGMGPNPSTVNVGWVTTYDPASKNLSVVQYGLSSSNLNLSNSGAVTIFTDEGTAQRNIVMHRAQMINLQPSTRYYYRVGSNDDGWSDVFDFLSLPPYGPIDPSQPLTFFVFGDMGTTNDQSLPVIINQSLTGDWHFALDVGDFAYDMEENNGTTGDIYFEQNEPTHARVLYQTCPGNHESAYNFQHYTYRWNTQPVNTGTLPPNAGTEVAGQPNNWWFSFNIANTHFVAISTEVWFYDQQKLVKPDMLAWLEADLQRANANRTAAPWIIVYGHRSIYCSCDEDCGVDAVIVREDLEPLFYTYGVDLWINGHEHNYERLYSIFKDQYMGGSGNLVQNPPATVYLVTGDAGNREGHEPFKKTQPPWSAFRSNTFGFSRMKIYNDTHIYWEQVMTDDGQPPEDMGKIIDYMWLVQTKHGPFATSGNFPTPYTNDVTHEQLLSAKTKPLM
jgi:hypothetical protein